MSSLSQIAKDPSCLLAVDALQGGRWLSCIKPDGVQPSSVPRNFAEEPETWYDFQNMQLTEDWAHDYTFECTFMLHTRDNPAPVLYVADAQSQMFGVYQYRDNTVGLFTTLCRQAASTGKYLAYIITAENATIFWESYHTVKIVVNGNSTSFYIDNELLRTFSSNYERTPKADLNLATPQTKTGYIGNCFIQDNTTGKIVWSYPTWEERTRLLTFTNITSSGGVFRAADDTKVAGIATPLDFRGNTTSKTFIVRAFCPAHDPASEKLYIHPLFGQGSVSGSSTQYTFQFSLWEDRRAGYNIHLRSSVSAGTTLYAASVSNVEPYLDQWHTYAMVVDYTGGNCYIRAFVDGVLLQEKTVSGTLVWNTPTATIAQESTVGIRRDPNTSVYAGSLTKVSSAMIFDRALTAAEIAAISNMMR